MPFPPILFGKGRPFTAYKLLGAHEARVQSHHVNGKPQQTWFAFRGLDFAVSETVILSLITTVIFRTLQYIEGNKARLQEAFGMRCHYWKLEKHLLRCDLQCLS